MISTSQRNAQLQTAVQEPSTPLFNPRLLRFKHVVIALLLSVVFFCCFVLLPCMLTSHGYLRIPPLHHCTLIRCRPKACLMRKSASLPRMVAAWYKAGISRRINRGKRLFSVMAMGLTAKKAGFPCMIWRIMPTV